MRRGASMIRLVCIDVDGTLVGADGVIHADVDAAMARARQAGIQLAVCSGRPGFGVTRDIAHRVQADGWHCFQNGASISHATAGRSLSVALEDSTVAALVQQARANGLPLELYTDDEYAVDSDAERARRHAGLLGVPFRRRTLDSLVRPIVRAQWLLSHAEAEHFDLHRYVGLEVSPSLAPSMPDTRFIGLTRAGVNKGAAVRAIAADYGVPLGEVMYIGDGYNDTPAMRIVGHPVAVRNAEPEALDLARHVVATAEKGGVAEALAIALAAEPRTRHG